MRSPSKALLNAVRLLSSSEQTMPGKFSALPVLDFVARHHDLDMLRISMELAVRKAACRVFAMEVLYSA